MTAIILMLGYETLDKIADSCIPLLAVVFLISVVIRLIVIPNDRKRTGKVFLYGLLLLIVSYALMFLDRSFKLWPAIGLDYSTHTAVSLSLVIPLCLLFKKYRALFIIIQIAYMALMLYQGYHSVTDVLVTAAPISLIAFVIYKRLF